MASRGHMFDADDTLLWGARTSDDGAIDVPVDWTDSEPPTVRSARSFPDADAAFADRSGVVVAQTAASADALVAEADAAIAEADGAIDEDEPCPDTLRSPVSNLISTNVRRSRVA